MAGLALTAVSVLPAALSSGPTGPTSAGVLPPTSVASAPSPFSQLQVFFGSLHAHTKYSDGSGVPADAFARARTQGDLDFLLVSEHNHAEAERGIEDGDPRKDGILIASNATLYNGSDSASLISAARAATVEGQFVALYGQEFSTISSGNHINVFDVGDVINVANGDFATLYDQWLPKHRDTLNELPLVQFNHPNAKADTENPSTPANQRMNDYGLDDFGGSFSELVKHSQPFASLIEMVSGPALTDGTNLEIRSSNRHESDFFFYLNQGFHLAPTANQDNHFFNWGTVTRARTAVLAERLTKADILHALKARRVYATEDNNLQLRFLVNRREMGSIIHSNQPQDLSIEVFISDPNEPNAEYTVELFRDEIGGNVIEDSVDQATVEGNNSVTFANQRYQSGSVYYFIKVTQINQDGGEDRAWTSPIWIEPGTDPALTATPTPTPTPTPVAVPQPQGFVFSKKSEVYHILGCVDADRIKPENRVTSAVPPEDKRLHEGCPRKQ